MFFRTALFVVSALSLAASASTIKARADELTVGQCSNGAARCCDSVNNVSAQRRPFLTLGPHAAPPAG